MDAPTLYTENISCLIQTYFPVWSWPRAKWWQLSSQTVVRVNSESTLPKETKHDFLTNGTLLVILISTHRVRIICNGKMEYVMTLDPTESVVIEATSGQLKVIRELLCDDLRKKKRLPLQVIYTMISGLQIFSEILFCCQGLLPFVIEFIDGKFVLTIVKFGCLVFERARVGRGVKPLWKEPAVLMMSWIIEKKL